MSNKRTRSVRFTDEVNQDLDRIRAEKQVKDQVLYSNNLLLAGIVVDFLDDFHLQPAHKQEEIMERIVKKGGAVVYGTN